MNEKELQFYYPFRFYASRKYLKNIVNKIRTREDFNDNIIQLISEATHAESKMEQNRWFD